MNNYTSHKKKEVDNYKSEYTADDLFMLQEVFNTTYADHLAITQTFAQNVCVLMNSRKWNRSIFSEKTHLDGAMYSLIINNKLKNPSFYTVVTICAGLGLDLALANKLLASAGYTFGSSREHQIYSFLFSALCGKSIDEINEFLESMSVRKLGSLERRTN